MKHGRLTLTVTAFGLALCISTGATDSVQAGHHSRGHASARFARPRSANSGHQVVAKRTSGDTLGLEGPDFELRGDFDLVSAPGVAVLGIGIAGGLQGLRTAAIDPQKLSYDPCQHAGMRSNQTQFPAASHCGICIVVIKAACKTKKRPFERA